VDEVEEFFACFRVVAENTEHGAGHCLAVDLLHSSHHHAHVPAKNQYLSETCHAQESQCVDILV
jgi:hypothetical protein